MLAPQDEVIFKVPHPEAPTKWASKGWQLTASLPRHKPTLLLFHVNLLGDADCVFGIGFGD
jgi:hypothetical protein